MTKSWLLKAAGETKLLLEREVVDMVANIIWGIPLHLYNS